MTGQKSISILGCGWLGHPIAETLVQKGYRVNGSTTTPEKCKHLKTVGITPYLIDIDAHTTVPSSFFNTNILFITLPFKRSFKDPTQYRNQLNKITTALQDSPIEWVLFSSSTAIYSCQNEWVSETDIIVPDNDRAQTLLACENDIRALKQHHTILRYAGLYGGSRKPGRFLENKKLPSNGKEPVNLIHQSDAVALTVYCIENNTINETFNIVSTEHPSKKDFYTAMSSLQGHAPPRFSDNTSQPYKCVSNKKIIDLSTLALTYPDPLLYKGET